MARACNPKSGTSAYIGHGYISVKPDIAELNGKRVRFVDDSEEEVDSIIYATGYKTTFPFLPKTVFDPEIEAGRLYRRMVSLKHPNLIFAGLVQPVGPTIPLVELQGKWIAGLLARNMKLPSIEAQTDEVNAHREKQRKTYLNSERYILEVDFRAYSGQMKADLASGKTGTCNIPVGLGGDDDKTMDAATRRVELG